MTGTPDEPQLLVQRRPKEHLMLHLAFLPVGLHAWCGVHEVQQSHPLQAQIIHRAQRVLEHGQITPAHRKPPWVGYKQSLELFAKFFAHRDLQTPLPVHCWSHQTYRTDWSRTLHQRPQCRVLFLKRLIKALEASDAKRIGTRTPPSISENSWSPMVWFHTIGVIGLTFLATKRFRTNSPSILIAPCTMCPVSKPECTYHNEMTQ